MLHAAITWGQIWALSVAVHAVTGIPALIDFSGAGVASIWVPRLSLVLLVWCTVLPGMGRGGMAWGCCSRSWLPFPLETGKLRPGHARALCLACGVGHCFCYRAGTWVAFCSFITLAAFGGRIVFKQKQTQDVRPRADSGDGLMHVPFPNSWPSTQKPWGVSKKPPGFLLVCSAPLGQTLAATSPPPFQRWGWDCAGKMLSALKEAFRSC